MKIIEPSVELVSKMLAQYEAEQQKANEIADEALRIYNINRDDVKSKIHFDHMHMDAITASGKVAAAKEILTVLKEINQ